MEDIDSMLSDLLGEIDNLSQSFNSLQSLTEVEPPGVDPAPQTTFSIGFTNLDESLHELEDHELDALVADLEAKVSSSKSSTSEETRSLQAPSCSAASQESEADVTLPKDSTQSCGAMKTNEPQTKENKIKMALCKLKEAKMRKLIIKVLMSDSSSKTLMVDERQTVREVLDALFEKTHCDCSIDWSLCETNPDLQIERSFEDHEHLVEPLSAWTRYSENKLYFLTRPQKYMMFTEPQLFYMWKKEKSSLSGTKSQDKEILIKDHFGGSTLIVPDLEGTLYLKEDGKKVWKPRYFMLRASGIYYVPKGKSKSSTDLICFIHFDNVNIYTTSSYKQRYRAPTDFCFILKHPSIQKESPYIRFLCCDNEHMLLLWVNSIRIAKYGNVLYKNYQAAVMRASNLQTLCSASYKGGTNGHSIKEDPKYGLTL